MSLPPNGRRQKKEPPLKYTLHFSIASKDQSLPCARKKPRPTLLPHGTRPAEYIERPPLPKKHRPHHHTAHHPVPWYPSHARGKTGILNNQCIPQLLRRTRTSFYPGMLISSVARLPPSRPGPTRRPTVPTNRGRPPRHYLKEPRIPPRSSRLPDYIPRRTRNYPRTTPVPRPETLVPDISKNHPSNGYPPRQHAPNQYSCSSRPKVKTPVTTSPRSNSI